MVLHRSRGALAAALALMVVGCAADAADEAQGEAVDEAAPAQALVLTQSDVSSADNGTVPATPSGSSGSGRAPTQDVDSSNDEDTSSSTGSTGGNTTARPQGGNWDAASVARFCFLLDQRAQLLCRVTLTDCTKPARALDVFTQVLCQLRGFLPGGGNTAPSSSSGSSSSSSGRADPSNGPRGI